jgi:hypothetical protein
MLDATVPHGWHYYWKSWDLPKLTDHTIDVLVEHTWALTSPLSYCIVFQLGGAVARVSEDETAYSHRDLGFNLNINAVWTADDLDSEKHIRWARAFWPRRPAFGPRSFCRSRTTSGSSIACCPDRCRVCTVSRLRLRMPLWRASSFVMRAAARLALQSRPCTRLRHGGRGSAVTQSPTAASGRPSLPDNLICWGVSAYRCSG